MLVNLALVSRITCVREKCVFVLIKDVKFKATRRGFSDVECAGVRPGSRPRLQKLFLSHRNTLWHLSLL